VKPAPGGSSYTFDGSTTWLSRGSLVGAADGSLGTMSLWLYVDSAGDGTNRKLVIDNISACYLGLAANDKIALVMKTDVPGNLLVHYSDAAFPTDQWVHYIGSWSLTGTPAVGVYINGVAQGAPDTLAAGTVDSSGATAWGIGDYDEGAIQPFTGSIAELYYNQAEYIDLSVAANRALFITPELEPVDLGSDGSKPTGTAPIIYMPFRDLENKGTGGQFTENGTITSDAGPRTQGWPGYEVQGAGSVAHSYNGNQIFNKTTDFTGNADGKVGSFSCWVNFDGSTDGQDYWFFGNASTRLLFYKTSGNRLAVLGRNAAGEQKLLFFSTNNILAGGGWRHMLVSWDLGAATPITHLYIDGTEKNSQNTAVDDTLQYTIGAWGIGAATGTNNPFVGKLAELWLDLTTYIDFSVAENREKFISTAGNPVFLGANGHLPTGSQPICYMKDGGIVNSGSGGDFNSLQEGVPTKTQGPGPTIIVPSGRGGN
jgi:hypothetical protein